MNRLIFISLAAILVFGCGDYSAEIKKLQKSNDALQQKNDSLNHVLNEENEELDDLLSGINSPGSEYINVEEDARIAFDKNLKEQLDKLKTPSKTIPFEEEADELTDDNPDNNVSNPFGGSGGGQAFGGGSMGTAGGDGIGLGDGPTGGLSEYGDLVRINSPVPPQYETEFSGNICVELLIDQRGAAISAKSFSSTNHPEKEVIDSVVLYVAKNIRFKAEPGAPNRKAFYTVYVQAN